MIITKKRFNNLLGQIADLQVDCATFEGQVSYLKHQLEIKEIENKVLKDKVKELKKNKKEDKPKRKVGRPKKEN